MGRWSARQSDESTMRVITTYSNAGAITSRCVRCRSCPPGRFADAGGDAAAEVVAADATQRIAIGAKTCAACPAGFFAEGHGNVACVRCPEGRTTPDQVAEEEEEGVLFESVLSCSVEV